MNPLYQFKCRICEEKYDVEYRSQRDRKICCYCAGEVGDEKDGKPHKEDIIIEEEKEEAEEESSDN